MTLLLTEHISRYPVCNFALLVSLFIILFASLYRFAIWRKTPAYLLELKLEMRKSEKDGLGNYEGGFTLTDCVSGYESIDAVRIVRDDNYIIVPCDATKALIREYYNKISRPTSVLVIALGIFGVCLLLYLVSWIIFMT